MRTRVLFGVVLGSLLLSMAGVLHLAPVQGFATERVEEALGRGLTVQRLGDGSAYLSWRLLNTDAANTVFHIARSVDGGAFERITQEPVRETTDYLDRTVEAGRKYTYRVVKTQRGGRSAEVALPEAASPYRSIKLAGNHTFQKVAIADLDGDGHYDYVIKQPNENSDPWHLYYKPSEGTFTLEAYRHDGTFLWQHDLGWSIERGIWYSPYVVYDLDGDGKAEVVLKAGEGDPREEDGRVKTGPEYLLVLDGETGKERVRVDWPSREGFENDHPVDPYNRASRNQMCIAYLDGKTPSLFVLRGTYNFMKGVAYNFADGKLDELWRWDNAELPESYRGGAHKLMGADLDGDGRDEILVGSFALDSDGSELWTTGLGHPDHAYVGDLDPSRPGLEIYFGHEWRQERNGMCMVDAATGEVLWGIDEPTRHVHSYGMCADIDPRHPGAECYSADTDPAKGAAWARLHTAKGEVISDELRWGFGPQTVLWDADPQKELLYRNQISNYHDGKVHGEIEGRVIAILDLDGDWREEIITTVEGELRIYSSTIPATDRRVTLMQDPHYRNDVAVASMGYYMPPLPSYDLATQGAK